MIKRYMVFGYNMFYPSGGMNDYLSSHDDIEEAKGIERGDYNNYHIYDRDTDAILVSAEIDWSDVYSDWKGGKLHE